MVVEHKYKIGFKRYVLIEPKPLKANQASISIRYRDSVWFLKRVWSLRKKSKGQRIEGSTTRHWRSTASIMKSRQHALWVFSGSCPMQTQGDAQLGWDTDSSLLAVEIQRLLLMRIPWKTAASKNGGYMFWYQTAPSSLGPWRFVPRSIWSHGYLGVVH